MDWKTKTGGVFIVLLIIFVLAYIVKVQQDTIAKLQYIEKSVIESKDIGNGIQRSQSSYVTRNDMEQLKKELNLDNKKLREDLRKLGSEVKSIHVVSVKTPGYNGNNLPSDGETPRDDDDQDLTNDFGYLKATQWLSLTEPFEDGTKVPFGRAGFSAWREKPWTYEVYPRQYSSVTVLAQDEDGRHTAYSRFEIESEGKKYVVPISQSKLVQQYPESKLRFSPRLYLGVDGGLVANPPARAEITPSLGVSLLSVGKTKVNPDWTFLYLGLGYASQSKAPVVLISPITYNLGNHVPLVNNLHIGPSLSADVTGNIGIYLGVKVGL